MDKKFRSIFNIASIAFLTILVLFYGYRLFYFYKIENVSSSNKQIKFYERLIHNKGIEGMNYGLQKDSDNYYFEAKSNDNYLYYLGRMWRIIGIDKDNNIKAITDEMQTILTWEEKAKFNDSNINTWLNTSDMYHSGIFKTSLKNNDIIINISLLTKKEYDKLDKINYLVSDNNYWIIDEDDDRPTYINIKGEVVKDAQYFDTFGVRPVITISSSSAYISGFGTSDSPYIINEEKPEKLIDTYVGEYLKYSDYIWRIIEVNDDSIKVALDDVINLDDTIKFSYDNLFNVNNDIGYYLNNDFYNSLSNNDYLLEKEYYIGRFNINDNYSYLNTYENSVTSKIGLYKIGDFFINSYGDFYSLTPSETSSSVIYVINKNKKLYADFVSSKYNARPTLYLDGNIFVLKGDGTKNKPYEIGR